MLSKVIKFEWIEKLKLLVKKKERSTRIISNISKVKNKEISLEIKPKKFILLQEVSYQTYSPLIGELVTIIVNKGDSLDRVIGMEDHYSNGLTLLTLEVCQNAERSGILKAIYTDTKSQDIVFESNTIGALAAIMNQIDEKQSYK